VTLVAVLVRFVRLGQPDRIVFDEIYYVPDGWTITNNGYESEWPENKDELWASGQQGAYLDQAEYVVHPPLGKYLIGIFMHLFGAEHVWAWRFGVALFGAAAVPLLYFVGKKLFGSIALGAIAAGMLAIDGHAIAMSRTGILDIFVMFFVLLGFLFLLYDRDDQNRKLSAWVADWRRREHAIDPSVPLTSTPSRWRTTIHPPKSRPTGPDWGPVLCRRPWFVAMAFSLALATSVKWSGLYYLALFCVLSIGLDAYARKREGITLWLSAAVLKQGPASFLLAIPLTLVTYVVSYGGWFLTGRGYNGIVESGVWQDGRFFDESTATWRDGSLFDWLRLSFSHFVDYQQQVYEFHSRLAAGHSYNSAPYEWPFLLRPTAFQYTYIDPADDPSCHANQCVEAVTSLSNPLLYWLGTIAIVFLIMMLFVKPRWPYVAILVSYAAGYLPWLLTGRTSVYHFYVIVWLPFMFLAAALALQTVAGDADDPRKQRTLAVNLVTGFFVLAILVSIFFYPVWTGLQIPDWYFNLTHWLPGWY
jgi:dolichyl-phosphate-mannose--protein O-mannosyl transferase